MTITSIIAAHSHPLIANKPSIHFKSHGHAGSCGVPEHYTVISHSSGKVDRVEYLNTAEFMAHRRSIMIRYAQIHARAGRKSGCMCFHCSDNSKVIAGKLVNKML